jgi:hypothetical protein
MIRLFAAVFVASLLLPGASPQANAQTKPKAKCVPIEACIKACGARGGQIRLCPKYCNDRARERGC